MFMIKYSKSDLWPTIGRKKKQQITSLPASLGADGGDGCSDGHVCLINAMARQSRAEKKKLRTDDRPEGRSLSLAYPLRLYRG